MSQLRLIAVRGLAERFGVTEQHVRTLMRYEGAPRPLDVEGGRLAVYDTGQAVAYLSRLIKKRVQQ